MYSDWPANQGILVILKGSNSAYIIYHNYQVIKTTKSKPNKVRTTNPTIKGTFYEIYVYITILTSDSSISD